MNAAASQGGVLRAGRQRRRLAHANSYVVFTVSTPNQTKQTGTRVARRWNTRTQPVLPDDANQAY